MQQESAMSLTKAKKQSLRKTVAGNAFNSFKLRDEMPIFKEVSLELAMMSEQLFKVAGCLDPAYQTCEDVRRDRDAIADRMIALMKKWKTA
jgi:hypothetical protein